MGRFLRLFTALSLLCGVVLSAAGCNQYLLEKLKQCIEQVQPPPDQPPDEPPPDEPPTGGGGGI